MRRVRLFIAVLALAAVTSVVSAAISFGASPITYSLGQGAHAHSLVAGPEGAIWFSGYRSGLEAQGEPLVGRILPDGESRVFPLPDDKIIPWQIAAGPDGVIWLAESRENASGYLTARIGRISAGGELSDYDLGNHVGYAHSVTAGPDGAVWFTTSYRDRGRPLQAVGRIAPDGQVRLFRLPPHSGVRAITAGPDGNLWFSEAGSPGPAIGRITPSGDTARFPLPRRRWDPQSIVAGTEGRLWFGEVPGVYARGTNRIGRITTAGSIREFPVRGRGGTRSLVAGPGAAISFLTNFGDGRTAIGSIAPSGTAGEVNCLDPSCDLVPNALAIAEDGSLWFAAHKFYCHCGGGGTGIFESMEEEREAGLVGYVGS